MRTIGRREFLKGAAAVAATLTSLLLEACGRGAEQRRAEQQTPTPMPTVPSRPSPSLAQSPAVSADLAADTVLFNGRIITVDAQDSIAQAVAVKRGTIQAVGSNREIRALVGENTKTIDLAGQSVTPGMIDPHNHMQVYGLTTQWFAPFLPPDVRTPDDLRRKLADLVAQTPEGEWIQGYYLIIQGGLPSRKELDPVSPNHPVWLMQQGGHYGSANSLALELAGIDASTPDPVGGVIERDASGEPTGVFYNHRAMDVLRRVAPVPTTDMTRDYVATGQPAFAAEGVTTFHDNNVRGVDTVGAYFDVDRAGRMAIRGRVFYTLEWPGDLDRALNQIEYYKGNGFMEFGGFKFLLDGQFHMAYCHEPHNGVRWDTPTWQPQTFKDAVRALHDTGLQICVHCVGDAAVDLTLDAFEEAMNANPRPDPRHRIEHCVITRPESTQRIKDLGVVVSTQPQFIRLGSLLWIDILGEERAARGMVLREWLDAGIPVALGSDAPTTPWIQPQVTLAGAVTRITLEDDRHCPEQGITAREALRAHTMGGAYAGFEEDIKGSIEPGKLADLVVWKKDPIATLEPFEGSGPLDAEALVRALEALKVSMTMVGGKVIHQA
ncbi:MAG: amidohydrolase [Anaerolineales bacterium]|nr:MAG: amidohydrolase [Anaerolineales bacterium]